MSKFEIVMPKLGESITDATITKWLKNVGDQVSEDESILEIATDKVDSEIPSPVNGILAERLFNEGDVVPVGSVIAFVNTGGEIEAPKEMKELPKMEEKLTEVPSEIVVDLPKVELKSNGKFLSPLIKNIALKENVSLSELNSIIGSGTEGRITKDDLFKYLESRKLSKPEKAPFPSAGFQVDFSQGDQIVEMDRMRKLIADHMVMSKQTSPHVTSFNEVDVTNLVKWRDKNKINFEKRENEKLTYTPIFIHAIAQAIKDFPMVNSSLEGTKIIIHKNINIGMAVALPSGNLIVPVIKNADQKSLLGIVKAVNDLAERARNNKLLPDEIQGGTFTITNLGSFGNLTGTPIINQPQVGIFAVGIIKKRPMVIETPDGDSIGIRQMMYASLSYDHRVVDGALGGMFLTRVSQYLEQFNAEQSI
ncbi:MAG: 2-oxo acid dehydrogenase subunit E2 [Bacteroidetes bacterium]|nr:2-oxo acid dehydrogenase subunit E2 [Bacteroidota bacterium]